MLERIRIRIRIRDGAPPAPRLHYLDDTNRSG
jgi:hypothetical protein